MRRQTLVGSVFSSLLSASILLPSLHAATQTRITTAVNDQARSAISGSVAPRAKAATDLGAAPANQQLSSVTLRFNMTATQSAALDQLLLDLQNPASPKYHQWLTPEQFGAQFGLSSADLAQVKTWLTSKGLIVTGTARSGTFLTVSGTVAQMNAAFNTEIHSVSLKGEKHFANLTEPTLPTAFAGVVSGVTGLNDFKLKSRARVRSVPAESLKTQYTSSISGSHYIAPGDFYTIYDVTPLLNSSINGTGMTIAVMGQTDISLTDAAAFRSASGLTANAPTVKLYGTDPGTSSADIDEAMLDVEWSGAVAPAATILYVNSNDVIDTSLTNAVDSKLAPILTISYGDCEANWGTSELNTYNQLFKQANAQGQTIVGPAGDSGATDCDYDATTATNGLAVDFPASSPYVTGLGGTQYSGDVSSPSSYWSTTNGTTGGSAISYIPETVWNETAADTALLGYASTFAAGGGGASAYFTKPAFQVGTGVPSDSSRDVPDVALNAAASHDGYLFCSQGLCTNGYRNASGNLDVVGGTSVATPTFAALLALVEQKNGSYLGNVNPTIYGLANSTYYGNVFHDVTTGNNNSPCTAGTTNCPGGGSIGFSATTGYDQATGWGSVDATNMVTYWSLVTPTGTTSTTGSTLSTTTLTASAFNVVAGTSITFTATVAAASSGTTPTGTVQFLVDSVAAGSAVTLSSGGVATYTLATTSLSTGVHTITAAYSGNTTYSGSKATTQVDITSATAADFSLSPSTATITVKSGATATPLTITLAPLNGFTGSVAFTASTTSSTLYATYAFSTNPVVISSTASGTTNFTLYAYESTSTTGQAKFGPVKQSSNQPTMPLWYKTGGSIAVAGLFLLILPRRRKWSALLLAVLSVGVIGASGCSSGTILSNGGSTGSTATSVNTTPGTYNITVTAYYTPTGGTAIAHDINVTFVVQ